MSFNIYYCLICQAELIKFGAPAQDAYEAICEYYHTQQEPMSISTDIHFYEHGWLEVIKFLELKNYIISHEHEDFIYVKPNGFSTSEHDGEPFSRVCPNNKKHW